MEKEEGVERSLEEPDNKTKERMRKLRKLDEIEEGLKTENCGFMDLNTYCGL